MPVSHKVHGTVQGERKFSRPWSMGLHRWCIRGERSLPITAIRPKANCSTVLHRRNGVHRQKKVRYLSSDDTSGGCNGGRLLSPPAKMRGGTAHILYQPLTLIYPMIQRFSYKSKQSRKKASILLRTNLQCYIWSRFRLRHSGQIINENCSFQTLEFVAFGFSQFEGFNQNFFSIRRI